MERSHVQKSAKNWQLGEASCKHAESRANSHHCERQSTTTHVRWTRTPSWLPARIVGVGVSHRESGGVAFNELRHDTTYSLHTREQRSDVQEQGILRLWRPFAREDDHHDDLCLAEPFPGIKMALVGLLRIFRVAERCAMPEPTSTTQERAHVLLRSRSKRTISTNTSTWPPEVCTYPEQTLEQRCRTRRKRTEERREQIKCPSTWSAWQLCADGGDACREHAGRRRPRRPQETVRGRVRQGERPIRRWSSHRPLLSSQCHPSHALSSSCSSWCMSSPISSCTSPILLFLLFSWTIPRVLFASSAFIFCSRVFSYCGSFLNCSSIAWQLDAPMFLFGLLSRLCFPHQHERVDACLCVHLLRILIPTCLAMETVRTLALTNPSPPSSNAANPNMHRYPPLPFLFPASPWPSPCTSFSSSLLTSARARSIDRAQPAPRTTHTEILCDPCPSFCTSCSDPCQTNDDIGITASNDVSHFPCRTSHWSRSASYRVHLPTKSTHSSGHCSRHLRSSLFSRGSRPVPPAWWQPLLVHEASSFARSSSGRADQIKVLDCSSLDFTVVLSLSWSSFCCPVPDGFESPALLSSVFSPSVATSSPAWSSSLARVSVWMRVHPVTSLRSLVSVSKCSRLWRYWVVCLMRMILHARPRDAWCRIMLCVQSQSSFGIPTRDDRWRWPSSVCPSLQDPWLRASPLSSASARLILSPAAASRAAPTESLFDRPSILFQHASLCSLLSPLASSQISRQPGTTFAETPLLEVCPAKVGPRYFVLHQHLSLVSEHHLSGSIQSNLDVERIVTAIWVPKSGSHLEYSASVPSLRLRDSPDVRRACLDRRALLGDNHCLWRWDPACQQTLLGGTAASQFPPLVGSWRACLQTPGFGVLSLRPCSLCSCVFPSLPMSHLFTKYAANSTSQHNILASCGALAPMRCSSAAFSVMTWPDNEPHRTLDDPVGLAFSHWRPLWHSLTAFLAGLRNLPRQCLNCRLVVAPERDSVVPELIDELRCSLCDRRKLCSFSRNQHSPRHLVSPFRDDQHRTHTILEFLLSMKPTVHWHMRHSRQVVLSIGSPVRRVHTVLHHTEFAP